MLRAALFDLDGVVRHHDPLHAARVEADAGLPSGALAAIAFEPGRVDAAVTGAVSFEQWRDDVAGEVARAHGLDRVAAAAVAERFFSVDAIAVDDDVLAIVRAARRRVPVGLLTNATSRLGAELDALGLTDEFDAVTNSSDLGVAKPDARAFVLAAERIGVDPGECFFTDDRHEHVEAATAAGLTAHHFTSAGALRAALAALGMLVPDQE